MKFRSFKITLALLFLLIAAGNLALLSKYNIYVGDDGYLASYLYEYHFTGSRSFVLCADWPIHQFLVSTLGVAYRGLYDLYLSILEVIGAEYHYINGLSALLFLATLAIYILTVVRIKRDWLVLASIVILGTLEPFLVMSHSIRTESVMLFALSVGIYSLTRPRADIIAMGGLFLAMSIILNTHLGGWPLLIGLACGTWYIFGHRTLLLYVVGGVIAMLIYLISNDLASIEALTQLKDLYYAQGSISSYTRSHVLNDVYSYFVHAKYKRHLIELIIVSAFFATATQWRNLGHLAKGLLLTTVCTFVAYVLMFSYINPYYLVYFYYLMLVSIVWAGNEILSEQRSRVLGLYALTPFVILYFAIFSMFIRSPGWDAITAQRNAIIRHIPEGSVVAAPEYFVNLDPRYYRSFVPLAQAIDPKSQCIVQYPHAETMDVIVTDTRQNDTITPYLGAFTLTERFKIGRLATQSLSDEGELFIYTRLREGRTSKSHR
jgi:hypothetical protein